MDKLFYTKLLSNRFAKNGFALLMLQILVFGVLMISVPQSLEARTSGYNADKQFKLFNSDTRKINELSGNWECSADEVSWRQMSLPLTFDNQEKVIFRKKINIGKSILKQYTWTLNFLGLSDNVEVYMNDQLVGKYFGGMTQFVVKIPQGLLHSTSNILKLVVSPSSDISLRIKQQNMYSKKINVSVLREVFLIGYPQVWVKDVDYDSKLSGDKSYCNINAKVKISSGQIGELLKEFAQRDSLGASLNGKVRVEVSAYLTNAETGAVVSETQSQNIIFASERAGVLKFNYGISAPRLWSPEQPNLYALNVKISRNGVVIDRFVKNIGVVEVKTRSGHNAPGLIYVNGLPMQIKGVDYIEDHIATGASLSPYRLEQEVISMKTLGVNVVRVKFSAPHPYFMYLCDKYGLFVIADINAYNIPPDIFKIFEVRNSMVNMAERLTLNYDNHPSLLAYGLCEGIIEGDPKVTEIQNDIIKLIRQNSHKLIFKNILISAKNVSTDGIDIIGIKDQAKFRTYEMLSTKLTKLMARLGGKPVVLNFGFPMQIGNSNGYTDPITVEAQRNYMTHIANIVNNYKMTGLIYWAFNDYQLNFPLLTVNNDEQDVCSVGLYSRSRQRRLSYTTLQVLYTGQDEQPILTAGNYSESTPIFYIVVGLGLLIILFFYARRMKRFREYLMRSVMHPYNFYADIRDQRIIAFAQTLLLAFVNSLAFGMICSAIAYYFRTTDIAQQLYVICIPIRSIVPGMFRLIWHPELFSLVLAAICLLGIFGLSAIIRIFAMFVKSRIFYADAVAIVVWASTPLLILLPLSMVLIRLMDMIPAFMILAVLIVFAFFVWYIMRIIKCTMVVFDVKPLLAYSVAVGFFGAIVLINIWYLNTYNALFLYLKYVYNYLMNV